MTNEATPSPPEPLFTKKDYAYYYREGYVAAVEDARRTECPYGSDHTDRVTWQDQACAAWLDGYDQFHQDS